mmetsp:Transcript_58254/g.102003  ORF Transcript_58254/g.102003 Transcript_58254/m.102003 type:complete len:140 (+) Transcript_58254:295-714(+)
MIYSYIFTFTLLSVVMTNVCQYFIMHPPLKPDCWSRWGPSVLMVCSTVLLLASPLKNLVVNICMASFRQNGFDSTIERVLDIAYMPAFGTRQMQVYTSMAYMFMFWGTAMQVDATGKFTAALKAHQAKGTKPAASKAGV